MSEVKPFFAVGGQSFVIANAVASAAAVPLAQTWEVLVLTNTSSTATAYVRITDQPNASVAVTGVAPTATTDLPILPLNQIRIYVGVGLAVIRAIASAADGNLIVTPGYGI